MGLNRQDADALDGLLIAYASAAMEMSPISLKAPSCVVLSSPVRTTIVTGETDEDVFPGLKEPPQSSRPLADPGAEDASDDDTDGNAPPKYSLAHISQELKKAAEEFLRKCSNNCFGRSFLTAYYI